MISNISYVIFTFTFFSVMGWILEVAYRSTHDGRFVNPRLFKGPYLILYGTAALVLMASISLIYEHNIFVKILCYFLITTRLELISGFNGQHFFNVRLWDYSDQRFQFKGHICLKFSIYWIILAIAFEYLVLPPYQSLISWLSPTVKGIFGGIGIFFMTVDFATVVKRKQPNFEKECQA